MRRSKTPTLSEQLAAATQAQNGILDVFEHTARRLDDNATTHAELAEAARREIQLHTALMIEANANAAKSAQASQAVRSTFLGGGE